MALDQPLRQGEYALRGDYHRHLDPDWDYYPTYRAKLRIVRAYLDGLPRGTSVLDAGCGEGLLVEEYADRLAMTGVDASYQSAHVQQASLTALPFADGHFARALCLDVLEHLSFEDQARALGELSRVLAPGGELLVSVPNLAHLQSRVQFLLRGRLIRTASPDQAPRRPSDRGVPGACRRGWIFARVASRHFPDTAGRHPVHQETSGSSRTAASAVDPRAARPGLVLPQPPALPSARQRVTCPTCFSD